MRLEVAKDLILRRGAKRRLSKGGSAVGALCLSQGARGRSARLARKDFQAGRKEIQASRKEIQASRKEIQVRRKEIQFQWVIAEFGRRLGRFREIRFRAPLPES
jgi:hypothetical protein